MGGSRWVQIAAILFRSALTPAFAGLKRHALYLGLTPQALCLRLLRRLNRFFVTVLLCSCRFRSWFRCAGHAFDKINFFLKVRSAIGAKHFVKPNRRFAIDIWLLP